MTTPDIDSSLFQRLLARLGPIAGAGCAVLLVLWLLDASGHDPPRWVSQIAVALVGTAAALWIGRILWRLGRDGGFEGRALLALLAASYAAHFIGLEFEIGQRYFGDEGIYRAAAVRINDGEILRAWFIYPHVLLYLDAFALWIAGLFQPVTDFLARVLYGVEGPHAVPTLVTRCVSSGLAALTVWPIFVIARRVAGLAAAVLAGTLTVLSSIFIEVSHLNISDVPSAFFATLTVMQVSRLLDRESTRDYVLAGVWAGLAAGSKYPAGVVAIAIVAIFLRWRWRTRSPGFGLLWAGLSAAATFVATTPSLLAFPDAVFVGSGPDIMFGYRQYARGGWPGVVRNSNLIFYLEQLRHTLGLPLLLAGVTGLAALRREQWPRLLWLLPFPLLFLFLMLRMNIAVPRNILPALPMIAAVLGIGLAGWWTWLGRLAPPRRHALAALGLAFVLTIPFYRTVIKVTMLASPTTRMEAAAWVQENLPPGSFFLQENYTPHLGSKWQYPFSRPRFVTRYTHEQVRDPLHDFIFLASDSYSRFLDPQNLDREAYEGTAERYREIFETFELVREWSPGKLQAGPVLRLYRVDPEAPAYVEKASLRAADAQIPNPTMRPDGDEGPILHHHLTRQWSLYKVYLHEGTYQVEIHAELVGGDGTLRVTNRDNEEVALVPWNSAPIVIRLPRPDKYFLYVHMPQGSRLSGLDLERSDQPDLSD